MNIKKGETYRIRGDSKYFKDKYGTCNPDFIVEDTDEKVWGKSWGVMQGNPTATLFAIRAGAELLDVEETVYYGKVYTGELGLAELVVASELEEI